MKLDAHVHSAFSCDGLASIEAMADAAIARGLEALCFTEHFDMNPKDTGKGFFDYEAFSAGIDAAREKYSGRLRIFKGLEFAEPHLYPRELEAFNRMDFDFILGSVHWVGDGWIGDEAYIRDKSVQELFAAHYKETLRTVQAGGFDSLAHIDFPKRYLKASSEPKELIDEILATLVQKGISLEINTSPLRKGWPDACPSPGILKRYASLGGRWITLGSDAHRPEEVAADFDQVFPPPALTLCHYEGRRRLPL